MIVVANAEPLLDQVADHRTGPDARLISSLKRSQFDDYRQRLALFYGQLRCRPFGGARPKALYVLRVIPLQPPIHAAARDAYLGRDLRDLCAVNVCANGTPSPPLGKVILALCLYNKRVELLELRRPTARTTDCLPGVGSSHDRLTMIF